MWCVESVLKKPLAFVFKAEQLPSPSGDREHSLKSIPPMFQRQCWCHWSPLFLCKVFFFPLCPVSSKWDIQSFLKTEKAPMIMSLWAVLTRFLIHYQSLKVTGSWSSWAWSCSSSCDPQGAAATSVPQREGRWFEPRLELYECCPSLMWLRWAGASSRVTRTPGTFKGMEAGWCQ